MKKMLLVASLLFCSSAVYATESSQYDDSKLFAQYNQEQIVTAYYVNGGQLVRIKIKISGGYVTYYSTSKDYVGQEQWHFAGNASIRQTNSTFDGELAREFNYTATLTISNGYQSGSIKIYF